MCDSFAAMPCAAAGGYTIYGKVSDRAVNEPQYFVYVPAADHVCPSKLRCTLIEIDQVPHTNAMILSKPSWIWGAEIGINEFGVCVGNESVYSKLVSRGKGLMGMDLVRIALERGKTARQALDAAAAALEAYGQGGNCSFDEEFYYDNAFMFADSSEAWIMETAGRFWAARRVRRAESISNFMSIGKPELVHAGAEKYARENGLCKGETFDFTEAFTDWLHPGNINGMVRKCCSQRVLDAADGKLGIREAIAVLQSHTTSDPFHHGNFSVCKHATGPDGLHQSTQSMIVELKPDGPVIWGAGMSIPCISLYKPFWFDTYSDLVVSAYDEQEQAMDQWLQKEAINRAIICGKIDETEYKAELQELQGSVISRFETLAPGDRKAFCDQVAQEEQQMISRWLTSASHAAENWTSDASFRQFWSRFNAQLGRNRTIFY